MQQPSDSLPHDDHLHLRTTCAPDEVVRGCEGGGPYWPWLAALPTSAPEIADDDLLLAVLEPMSERQVPLVKLPPPEGQVRRDVPASSATSGSAEDPSRRPSENQPTIVP